MALFFASTSNAGIFGISDEDRNSRMRLFDKWIQEVLMNSVLMTSRVIVDLVFEFLEVNKNAPSPIR